MSVPIRRLVLDVMMPHDPGLVEVTSSVAECPGVDAVNAVLEETDRKVQDVKFTIEGDGVDVSAVEATIEDVGGSVHSTDQVVCGERVVDQAETPQDR